jgi:hypothetical protein
MEAPHLAIGSGDTDVVIGAEAAVVAVSIFRIFTRLRTLYITNTQHENGKAKVTNIGRFITRHTSETWGWE